LLFIKDVLDRRFPPAADARLTVAIPTLTVITTELFDHFMTQNRLHDGRLASRHLVPGDENPAANHKPQFGPDAEERMSWGILQGDVPRRTA
jgi:hypothetical protein